MSFISRDNNQVQGIKVTKRKPLRKPMARIGRTRGEEVGTVKRTMTRPAMLAR